MWFIFHHVHPLPPKSNASRTLLNYPLKNKLEKNFSARVKVVKLILKWCFEIINIKRHLCVSDFTHIPLFTSSHWWFCKRGLDQTSVDRKKVRNKQRRTSHKPSRFWGWHCANSQTQEDTSVTPLLMEDEEQAVLQIHCHYKW